MSAELIHRLSKKKGGTILLLQNTTDQPIALINGSLTSGKPEKSAPMPNLIAPVSQQEIGFYSPEGQWSFAVQGDSSNKTRLTLLHSAQHANLERLPAGCSWSADLQQNWKSDVPQIVVTFTLKDSSPAPSPTANKSSSKADLGEAPTGSGKLKSKRSAKDVSDSKSKKEAHGEEAAPKKKRGARKSKGPSNAAPQMSSSPVAEDDHDTAFRSSSSGAFGIDAIMGDDSSSDEDGFGRQSSAWGKKFEIKQRDPSQANETDDAMMRRASSLFAMPPGSTTSKTNTSLSSAFDSPSISNDAFAAGSSSAAAGDDDFFADLDKSRHSRANLAIPSNDREKKLSQIPPSAQAEFDRAMEKLNQGMMTGASESLSAALSQLNQLAFHNNASTATQWCIYSQLVRIIVEMDRLQQEHLYAQRALLARFVGLLGLRLQHNPAHALICLRMAINRNLEMENFRTAGQLLQSFGTLPELTEMDRQNVAQKLEICASHDYSEAHIPQGASLDPVSGQFLLNGYSYALCHMTMLLIRDPTHHVCRYCDATFSEQATPNRKCYFCDSTLETQS